MDRRSTLRFLAATSLGLPLAARTQPLVAGEKLAMMTRKIPATGELLPAIGLGTWQTFDVGNDPAVLASIAGLSAYGRLIEPVEIAATLLFAAQSPVLNGAVVHANLGQIEH